MSILLNKETKLICQGLGKAGQFHCSKCVEYGTNLVGAVTPGKGGSSFTLENTPNKKYSYFNTVEEAVKETGANTSIIFVPASGAADAIMESANAGIAVVICITEGIPVLDMLKVTSYLKTQIFSKGKDFTLIGPNCPGVIVPGIAKVGIMPGYIHTPGNIGVISRSGTLTYSSVWQLTQVGLGQSTCIGIGGDPIIGSTFIDVLKKFEKDSDTHAVVMIGEIGGTMEEEAAEYIGKNFSKPVISFIAGQTAPKGKRMGHAGAIISGGKGTAEEKMNVLQKNGITIVKNPAEIGQTVKMVLGK